jgi:hypothetical protein
MCFELECFLKIIIQVKHFQDLFISLTKSLYFLYVKKHFLFTEDKKNLIARLLMLKFYTYFLEM